MDQVDRGEFDDAYDAAEAREYGTPQGAYDGEDLSPTEEALKLERDERDAALDEIYGEHADEFREQRLALAWWREENGESPFAIVYTICADLEGYLNHLDYLVAHGLPEGSMAAPVTLDMRSGPVVLAGLQVLGVMMSESRPDIAPIIKQIALAIPVPDVTEQQLLDDAQRAVSSERLGGVLDDLAGMFPGVEILSTDELVERLGGDEPENGGSSEPPPADVENLQDAGLN